MITYSKKNRFFKIKMSWFEYRHSLAGLFSINGYFHVKNTDREKIPAVKKVSHTVEVDLLQDEAMIFENLAKQVKQQFKTCEKEGIQCVFSNDIDKFVAFFNDFAIKRNTYTTSRERVEEIGSKLKICFAEKDGLPLVAHSYLEDEETGTARILHSATARLDDSFDKNLVGKAHKYLTVKSMLHYKNKGFRVFDLGGYAANTTDKGLQGINHFKMMFGGKVVPCNDYYSYPYWLFKKVSALLGLSAQV